MFLAPSEANPIQSKIDGLKAKGIGEKFQNYYIYTEGTEVHVIKLNPLEEVKDKQKKGIILKDYNESLKPKSEDSKPTEVFKTSGSALPQDIISDWDKVFTSNNFMFSKDHKFDVTAFINSKEKYELSDIDLLKQLGITFSNPEEAQKAIDVLKGATGIPLAKQIEDRLKVYPGNKLVEKPVKLLFEGTKSPQWSGNTLLLMRLTAVEGLARTASKPVNNESVKKESTPPAVKSARRGKGATLGSKVISPISTSTSEEKGFEDNLGCK